MKNVDEIFHVIKKWYDESLGVFLKIPEDLSDGRYYLELLKKCVDIDIPNSKNQNYEKIECTLNDYYGFQTNCVVDYYEFLYSPGNELIIILNIFCILFYQKHRGSPDNLNQDDFKRLLILTQPVITGLKDRRPPSIDNLRIAINRAAERDLGDSSSCGCPIKSVCSGHNSSKNESGTIISDDEISNSSNLRSFVSENSFNARSIHDSISDACHTADRSIKDSLRRKHKFPHNSSKSRRMPAGFFLSTGCRRTVTHSPKLNESRILEQRKMKNLEFENHTLKQDLCQLQDELDKEVKFERKLNEDIVKLKMENRKLMDNIDCLNSKAEENSLIMTRRDKEQEKLRKDLELSKKINGEKSDQIKQMEHSNHKLRQDIHELKNQIKSMESHCEESFKNKIDSCQEKRVLQVENEKLKNDKIDLQKQIEDFQKIRSTEMDPESLLDSPAINIEEGESLDIINQMKLAEMKEEYEKKIQVYKKDIENLNSLMSLDKENSENYQLKLTQQNEEIKMLREKNNQLELSLENYKNLDRRLVKETLVGNIVDNLRFLLSNKYFSNNEKTHLFKSASNFLDIDLNSFEQNHDLCEKEISILEQKIKDYKEEIERNTCHLYDKEQELNDTKLALSNLQIENSEIQRLWQNIKSKSDETEFKLKKTLYTVVEEKNKANSQIADLKKDLLICESDLEKSNQDFNMMRGRYDKCLETLRRMAKDCEDYEKIIIEITENQRKVLVDTGCQTEITSRNAPPIVNQIYGQRTTPRETSMEKRIMESINNNKRIVDSFVTSKLSKDSSNYPLVKESKLYETEINSYRNNYNQEPLVSSEFQKKLISARSNSEYDDSSFQERNFDRPISGNCKPLDPKWLTSDQSYLINTQQKSTLYPNRNISSPAVKPARLHQMISRNLQQPEHLKSSYPIETQALEEGYLADCLIKEINLECNEPIETDRRENTARSSNTRHISRVDPMNLRSSIHSYGAFNYTENSFSDELIKASNSNRLTPRDLVLSARSNNNMSTSRSEAFKVPIVPRKNSTNHTHNNLVDSDRENAVPGTDVRETHSDKESSSSISYRFDIVNTPKRKLKGNPRGFLHRSKKT